MTNQYSNFKGHPLVDSEIRALAPSVFATRPWEGMSNKYAFIPTIDVVSKMRNEGFLPYSVIQSRTRVPGKGDFTKHMLRFRDCRNGDQPNIQKLGQLFLELVLTNSHDGASQYVLDAGLWRAVCLNGLMVSENTLNQVKARHTGNVDDVIDVSYEVVEQFPKVLESVEQFQRLQLSAPQREAFGKAALNLKYDDETKPPVSPAQIVMPRRSEDRDPTLWNTFNVAQENLVNGGIRYRNQTTLRRGRMRPVNGISENQRLNKALWTLAEEMKKLVA